jgi:hypothetical protein
MLKLAAKTKYPTSRTKLLRGTWNGFTSAMLAATTAVMKPAAPKSSPTARLPLCEFIAANVEKTSGLPFPKARNVTPVKVSLMPRMFAMVLRFMHRKSEAAMPMVLKRSAVHITSIMNATGFALAREQ